MSKPAAPSVSVHQSPARLLADLNADYLRLHHKKEKQFWATYMGTSKDQEAFDAAEHAWKSWISDPQRLARVRAALEELEATLRKPAGPGPASPAGNDTARPAVGSDWSAALDSTRLHPEFCTDPAFVRFGLQGWDRLLAANLIETEEGRAAMERLIGLESTLFAQRRDLALEHKDESGSTVTASLPSLAVNLSTNPSESGRKSSLEAFYRLEDWVLDHGFADIIVARNRLARALGYRNYFDYKVQKTESMTPEALFAILDDFEARTRKACMDSLKNLAADKGPEALKPWNLRFFSTGDVQRQLDPYMDTGSAVERWVASFRALGISFRGATLQLDLLDRKGKYQNGFCHGPVPSCYGSDGRWIPGQINFTSLAQPGQVGSGLRALETLFHEGGHAAHFANVVRNSPCFSQEFPPTSMALAETQSMFCDSLLDDPDWLDRYARDAGGNPPPEGLLQRKVETSQPLKAFNARQILLVAAFEWPLYCMSDEELSRGSATRAAIKALARSTEDRILGLPSPRPLLAIPHLLNEESAASYHGYLLAEMAVHQTRAHFLLRDGFLTDNPRIGSDLARHYWAPGNSVTLDQALRNLTGSGFSGRAMAEACSLSTEKAWAEARSCLESSRSRGPSKGGIPHLDALIRVVHGELAVGECPAGDAGGEDRLGKKFADWVAGGGYRA